MQTREECNEQIIQIKKRPGHRPDRGTDSDCFVEFDTLAKLASGTALHRFQNKRGACKSCTNMTSSIVFMMFYMNRPTSARAYSFIRVETRNRCVVRNETYALTIPRNSFFDLSVAHGASGFPPFRQPSSSNNS
jgi:hypothetical protein